MATITLNRIAFASLLVVANAALAQAQEINSYEDFRLYCSDAAYQYDVASPDCDDYKPYYQERIQEEIQPQNTNPDVNKIKRRSTRRNDVSGYVGGSLGAFFPDMDGFNTGIGSSTFIGARWNQYLATDLEFIYLSGGTELDGLNYSAYGLAINPRFIIPFTKASNSASIFVSPGLGLSLAEYNTYYIDIEDEIRLTWQIKAGFTIPVGNKYNILLQGRYVDQFEKGTISIFSTELGFSVNF